MAIFKIQNKTLTKIKSGTFPTERELQELVDENLDKIFGLEFISGLDLLKIICLV
jgi:hypothetical protein